MTLPNLGDTATITIPAGATEDTYGKPNKSASLSITSGSPANEFEKNSEEIKNIVSNNSVNQLKRNLDDMNGFTGDLRSRYQNTIKRQECQKDPSKCNPIISQFITNNNSTVNNNQYTIQGNFSSKRASESNDSE